MIIVRLFSVFFLVGLVGLAILIHFADWPRIESVLSALPYRCPLKMITGLECAFCGMTHSWLALLRGEWLQAFHFNALGPFVFLASVMIFGAFAAGFRLENRVKPWMGIAVLSIFLVYAIVRNIH